MLTHTGLHFNKLSGEYRPEEKNILIKPNYALINIEAVLVLTVTISNCFWPTYSKLILGVNTLRTSKDTLSCCSCFYYGFLIQVHFYSNYTAETLIMIRTKSLLEDFKACLTQFWQRKKSYD